MDRLIFESFLFAIAGIGLEVVETAFLDYPKTKDIRLQGHASVWYIPFYAVLPLAYLSALGPAIFPLPLPARAVIYTLSFFALEYLSMGLLRLTLGKSPSEDSYRKSRWNVHGLIRLDLWPVWMAFGLIFEWMFRNLRRL